MTATTGAQPIIDAVLVRLNDGRATPVVSLVGEKHVFENGAPPRLVWVPGRDSFGPAEKGGTAPRQLRTRIARFDVHVWGADFEATEALVNDTIAAIYLMTRGSFELSEGEWVTAGELLAFGAVCILGVSFKIPVTEAPSTTKVVTTIVDQAYENTQAEHIDQTMVVTP